MPARIGNLLLHAAFLLSHVVAWCAEPDATTKDALTILLRGEAETELAPHGTGNVYAPDVHHEPHSEHWRMWYGGQGRDGHDRIHFADSENGVRWTKHGVVVDRGAANHVNDPSVVRVGGEWWMFYTVAEAGESDEIAAASSLDGLVWQKRGVVLPRGTGPAWDSLKVGRPSVLFKDAVFRMWFDGQPAAEAVAQNPLAAEVKRLGRAVGYAESRDGLRWECRPEPVFYHGAGAVHVAGLGAGYVMVSESSKGIYWADSADGLAWTHRGQLTGISGGPEDRFGRVTPFLLLNDAGRSGVLFFGAAPQAGWNHNSIASQTVTLPGDAENPPR